MRTMALLCCVACLSALPLRADPVLRPGPGQPAPQELITQIIQANAPWLHPAVKSLSYAFKMRSDGRPKPWTADVYFRAPDSLIVDPGQPSDKRYEGKVNVSYDPEGWDDLERFTSILQGVTFYGPLHELVLDPTGHELLVIGDEKLGDADATIVQIKLSRAAFEREARRREKRIRAMATDPRFLYRFLPVLKPGDGVQKVVMEINCLGQEGPGWEAIKAAHAANPSSITWGGLTITSELRDFGGAKFPVLVIDKDPQFTGQSPIKGAWPAGSEGKVTDELTLGEGEPVFDEARAKDLRAKIPQSEPNLAMRVGRGIWPPWVDYHRWGGCSIDQVWFDKATHTPLREQGFRKEGANVFTVEYGDYEPVTGGHQMPRHVVVTLNGKGDTYPRVLDMTFDTHGGAAWLLNELSEYQGNHALTATAKTTDVVAEAATPGK